MSDDTKPERAENFVRTANAYFSRDWSDATRDDVREYWEIDEHLGPLARETKNPDRRPR